MLKKILIIITTFLILLFLAAFFLFNFLRKNYYSQAEVNNQKTNLLLLGINGNGGGDADLTDTIIFASLDQKKQTATLISVPRDIWLEDIKAKINTAYHYGGMQLAEKEVSEVLGQEIDYVLVLDFGGFEKIIDYFGGIQVDVQRSFDDFYYPISGKENDLCNGDRELKCRYEALHFEKGRQTMNGSTALKFVRSRNAQGEEGTDFARSQRQILVLKALKEKVLNMNIFELRKKNLQELFDIFDQYLKTDIQKNQYGNFFLLGIKINWDQIKSISIDENLLVNPRFHYSKQWVLLPKDKNLSEIHEYVKKVLE